MSAAKVTADDVRAALKARYPAPEYAVLFEVTDATGAQHTRSADAVVMSCWPSRGLELHGVEIKVSRSDWLHERSKPKKAETIAAYCDRWWLVTGPGVINDVVEIPPAWGWAEYVPEAADLAGGRQRPRLVTRKEPAQTDSKPIDRLFLAALLRNAAKVGDNLLDAARREARAEATKDVDKQVSERLERRAGRVGEIVKQVEDFEAATGISLGDPNSFAWMEKGEGRQIGEMVMAVRKAGLANSWGGLPGLFQTASAFVGVLQEHAGALGIELPKPKKRGAR